jgi:hypothetical protein
VLISTRLTPEDRLHHRSASASFIMHFLHKHGTRLRATIHAEVPEEEAPRRSGPGLNMPAKLFARIEI